MAKIKIAIVGIGNCASSLLQGIHFYKNGTDGAGTGLMRPDIGGYLPGDIEVAAAFDIDSRKVGLDVADAIGAPPNCTKIFFPNVPPTGVTVKMGCIMDGCAAHMLDYEPARTFLPSEATEPTRDEVIAELKSSGAEMLLNYLPVGSEDAARFYAGCALDAGLGLINNIPVFIASDPKWAARFAEKGLPLIGDDIKAQVGATITHRTLVELFAKRGVKISRTYQLNVGGNTDFLNMLNRQRLASKKTSKTEAVQSVMEERLSADNIHIGPSDYVPWQNDNKICYIRIEGRLFGDIPMEMDVKLSVEDSPNSAGVAIDTIRLCKLALDRGKGGVLYSASACYSKHPPMQLSEEEAHLRTDAFIRGERED
jgi:myo-inositol-1-phosphate synthase